MFEFAAFAYKIQKKRGKGMKKRKWWKPVITIGVIVAVIAIAAVSLMKYLESRSVQLTKTDVLATVNFLSGYLIALGVILAICAVAAIAVVKLPKARRSLARTQAGVAAVLAVVVIVNMVCMGPEYGIINNLFAKTYYLSDDTVKASEQLVKDIADEGIVMLKNEDGMLPLDGEMKLNVFGWSSVGPVYGGIGSGAVDENDCLSLLKGLEDAGFVLNGDIEKFYRDFLPKRRKSISYSKTGRFRSRRWRSMTRREFLKMRKHFLTRQ